jgi:hypothetical protein
LDRVETLPEDSRGMCQSFDLCDMSAFKMNIYHTLKVSYIIRHVIIKYALVKELLIL